MPNFILLFTNENDICDLQTNNTSTSPTKELIFHITDSVGHLKAFDVTELTGGPSDDPLLRFPFEEPEVEDL